MGRQRLRLQLTASGEPGEEPSGTEEDVHGEWDAELPSPASLAARVASGCIPGFVLRWLLHPFVVPGPPLAEEEEELRCKRGTTGGSSLLGVCEPVERHGDSIDNTTACSPIGESMRLGADARRVRRPLPSRPLRQAPKALRLRPRPRRVSGEEGGESGTDFSVPPQPPLEASAPTPASSGCVSPASRPCERRQACCTWERRIASLLELQRQGQMLQQRRVQRRRFTRANLEMRFGHSIWPITVSKAHKSLKHNGTELRQLWVSSFASASQRTRTTSAWPL